MVHEIFLIICESIVQRKVCREISTKILVTFGLVLNMIDFIHEKYALGIVYLFTLTQMVLFSLKRQESLTILMDRDGEQYLAALLHR